VARILIEPADARDRLTAGMYLPKGGDGPVALIERALTATIAAAPIETRIKTAIREERLDGALPPGAGTDVLAARARTAGVITASEADAVIAARELTAQVIRVDDFGPDLGVSLLMPANPVTVHDAATTAPRVPDTPRRRAAA
jgi:acyl-CoA dehydrogenase